MPPTIPEPLAKVFASFFKKKFFFEKKNQKTFVNSGSFYLGGQHIPAAADGFYQLGVAAVIFQFAAEAADGDVDGAVEGAGLAAAQEVEQHVAGEDAVGAFDEGDEEVVFATGEGDFDGVRVHQAAAGGFQDPAVE